MGYKDPDKQREYQREWQRKNYTGKFNATTYQKRKKMVADAKSSPCAACGKSYPPVVMDLHHRDPSQKDGMVSKLLKSSSMAKLQEEIDKCVCLCSNCHRLLHAGLIDSI